MRTSVAILAATLLATAARADLKVYPPAVALRNAADTQPLLVVEETAGRATADRTSATKFTTANPAVATITNGVVTPVGNGKTTITATVNGQSATVEVTVSGAKSQPVYSFTNHVLPALTRTGCNSGACHGALAGKGGFKLSLRGYDPEADHFAMTRQAAARRTDRDDPAGSLLLKKATRAMTHGGGRRFDEDSPHYRTLLGWVQAGADGAKATDPALTRIEVFPQASKLVPKEKLQVRVRGHYSDGSTQDVTRLAKFASTGDLVAAVDEDGLVTVAGPGEAAIVATFGTTVATTTVTVPFPTAVEAAAFDNSPKHNFIDEHVLVKLRDLRVPPSGQCTDSEFVRRAFLDCCGVLPKPEEVDSFLADKSADKRSKLIDKLLDRPEFVDYWAHKWSDLLLVSSRRLPQPAMWAFYRSIRQAVADNVPWDRFARSILTARGSTFENGAANYFVIHKDVSDLTETTAVTFLGMSINCCRCHNHPLERWTQDEYWATANLFGRVGIKNGDRAGELFVFPKADGDALHLRRGTPTPPAPLGAKPMPADGPTDRREYFADWLTSPTNPYFAKAVVNRVWRNFLGRGLVDPEDDLRESNPPTNRPLFDTVAADFVKNKYDVKHLIRTVMNSAAYQRSAKPLPGNAADDRFYSRYLIRRLPAEIILDAQSDVTGMPTPFTQVSLGPSGGFAANNTVPMGTRAVQLPDSLLVSEFLDQFGRAERLQTCACERTTDASVSQALHLNNGKTLNDKLKADAGRPAQWVKEKLSDAEIVDRLYKMTLVRRPTDGEKARLIAALAEATTPAAKREVVEDLFWAVLTSQEFLFNR